MSSPTIVPSLRAAAAHSRCGIRAAAILALASLISCTAVAAEEAAAHAAPSKLLLLLNVINFGIYAFILWRFAWPAIVNYLRARRAGVVAALEAAAKARAEAEAMKAAFDAKMQTLEADAERARAELLAIAELEARQLLEQARRSADRIRADARLVADQEVARARRLLQEETAELVTRVAGDVLARSLTADDQRRFVGDFLTATRRGTAGGGAPAR